MSARIAYVAIDPREEERFREKFPGLPPGARLGTLSDGRVVYHLAVESDRVPVLHALGQVLGDRWKWLPEEIRDQLGLAYVERPTLTAKGKGKGKGKGKAKGQQASIESVGMLVRAADIADDDLCVETGFQPHAYQGVDEEE